MYMFFSVYIGICTNKQPINLNSYLEVDEPCCAIKLCGLTQNVLIAQYSQLQVR